MDARLKVTDALRIEARALVRVLGAEFGARDECCRVRGRVVQRREVPARARELIHAAGRHFVCLHAEHLYSGAGGGVWRAALRELAVECEREGREAESDAECTRACDGLGVRVTEAERGVVCGRGCDRRVDAIQQEQDDRVEKGE